jgi:hypothetical protein
MKNVFLAIFALSSLSVFANNYETRQYSCNVSGDYSTISSPKKKKLNTVPFNVVITYLAKKDKIKKVLKTSISTDLLSAPIAKKGILEIEENVFANHFTLDFQSLDIEDSIKLLNGMGANVDGLPYGFNFTKKLNMRKWGYRKVTAQVHYPIDINDGLSFHASIECFHN